MVNGFYKGFRRLKNWVFVLALFLLTLMFFISRNLYLRIWRLIVIKRLAIKVLFTRSLVGYSWSVFNFSTFFLAKNMEAFVPWMALFSTALTWLHYCICSFGNFSSLDFVYFKHVGSIPQQIVELIVEFMIFKVFLNLSWMNRWR